MVVVGVKLANETSHPIACVEPSSIAALAVVHVAPGADAAHCELQVAVRLVGRLIVGMSPWKLHVPAAQEGEDRLVRWPGDGVGHRALQALDDVPSTSAPAERTPSR